MSRLALLPNRRNPMRPVVMILAVFFGAMLVGFPILMLAVGLGTGSTIGVTLLIVAVALFCLGIVLALARSYDRGQEALFAGEAWARWTVTPEEHRRLDERSRELGLWGLDAPEALGGSDLPLTAKVAVNEEMGRTVTPYDLPPDSPNLRMLMLTATEEQRVRYLEPYVRGETTSGIAISEPGAGAVEIAVVEAVSHQLALAGEAAGAKDRPGGERGGGDVGDGVTAGGTLGHDPCRDDRRHRRGSERGASGAVVGLLTVVVAVAVHEVSELMAVGNGVRAARAPEPAPAAAGA